MNISKPLPEITEKVIERFLSKVNKSDSANECWEWTGGKFRRGYGAITISKRTIKAHRVAYYIANNKDPHPRLVLHSCDNPTCCNPSHLFEGTDQDNSDDRQKKGRTARGEKSGARLHPERTPRGNWWRKTHTNPASGEQNGASKLTTSEVIQIRNLYRPWKHGTGLGIVALGKRFDISKSMVHNIVAGKWWKNVK